MLEYRGGLSGGRLPIVASTTKLEWPKRISRPISRRFPGIAYSSRVVSGVQLLSMMSILNEVWTGVDLTSELKARMLS